MKIYASKCHGDHSGFSLYQPDLVTHRWMLHTRSSSAGTTCLCCHHSNTDLFPSSWRLIKACCLQSRLEDYSHLTAREVLITLQAAAQQRVHQESACEPGCVQMFCSTESHAYADTWWSFLASCWASSDFHITSHVSDWRHSQRSTFNFINKSLLPLSNFSLCSFVTY